MQALLHCDHDDEAAILSTVLARAGFEICREQHLGKVIDHWPLFPLEFILLAFRGEVPFVLIKRVRALGASPCLVIVDPQEEAQLVSLWETGVDLVVTRPFSATLLVAQVKALSQRVAGVPHHALPRLREGRLILDPLARTVQVGDELPRPLTRREFRLLYTLMTHPGQVFPAERLVEHVWGYSDHGDRNLLRGLVKRVRAKAEPVPSQPRFILTRPGVGYYFRRRNDLGED